MLEPAAKRSVAARNKLRRCRRILGLRLKDMAEALDCSISMAGHLERGYRRFYLDQALRYVDWLEAAHKRALAGGVPIPEEWLPSLDDISDHFRSRYGSERSAPHGSVGSTDPCSE